MMSGEGFAFFRWRCNLRWALAAKLMGNPDRHKILLSMWGEHQRRVFNRKLLARGKAK